MKKPTSILLFISLFFAFTSYVAQENFKEQERSIITIERGVKFHEEEKYDEAVEEFKKVHRNDSNYYLASVEILNTYLAQKKNKEGLELCNYLLKLNNEYTPNILIYKGDFLDELGRFDESKKVYEQGMKDYPLNHSFAYEMGISKLRKKKFDEAFELFVKSAKLNPFHASSHIQLGYIAYRSNNITAAALAYQFSLLCEARTKRMQGIVSDLEKMTKLELETDSVISIKAFENENNFSELESLVRSKVALGDRYKSKTALKFDLTKQMQLIIENVGKYKNVNGFYNEFYGNYFAELQKEKHLEPYSYYSLRGMELEKINKWLIKKKPVVDKFEIWSYNYMCEHIANYSELLNDKKTSVPHWFSGGYIVAAGVQNSEKQNEGYWNFYYKNGIKKSEGAFINGKKNGVWKFYNTTGSINEETTYNNGIEKFYKSFYDNNNLSVELAIADNKISGTKKVYFSNGNIAASTEYQNGEINGLQTYFYRNGSNRYTIKNVNNILSGDLIEYFDNGKINQKATFVNNNREGPAKTFWNNKDNSVETEGNYVKGKPVGKWKTYYRSGKLYKELNYNKDGELDGELKQYHENGKLETEEIYSNGKLNGLSKDYTDDGILWQEFLYKKGKLLESRAYKKDGTEICDDKINGKNFQVIFYHPNGIKRREGKVSDGELEGVWKDYSSFGVLTREISYKEGKFDGKYVEYHPNGKIKVDRTYKLGTEDGYYKSFYINGNVETEGMIVDGENEGYWKSYYKDGSLENYSYYLHNQIDGWNEYFDVNGKVESESLYRENCLIKVIYHDTTGEVTQNIDLPGGNGTLEKRSPEGKIIFKRSFVKDYIDGFSSTFYPDGKIETQVEYKNGKREGKALTYNGVGTLTSESPYFNNQKEGKETDYFFSGKVSSEDYYDNGSLNGKCKSYFENGKLHRDINYNYGDAEGESNMYDEFGELIYTRNFHNGLLISYSYKDAKGQLLPPIKLTPGDSKLLCYFPNQKKSFEATYTNGDLNGKRIIYCSNGKVTDETTYYFDILHEQSKDYYSNGTLKASQNYYYGSLEGKTESRYENGNLKLEGSYRKGKEHGWFKFYDVNGKLIKSILYYSGDPILVK